VTKAKAGVVQAQDALNEAKAAVANAQAALAKEKAADDLAKTREQMFLNVSKLSTDAISRLRVDEAIQQRLEADAAVRQADEGLKQAQAAEQGSRSALAAAQAVMSQAEAAALLAKFAVAVAESAVPGVEAQLDDARFNGGQFVTAGTIPTTSAAGSTGAYAVRILFSDEAAARNLSLGSRGTAAIYTKVGAPFHIISKVTIRDEEVAALRHAQRRQRLSPRCDPV
jgi:hypothetical protein